MSAPCSIGTGRQRALDGEALAPDRAKSRALTALEPDAAHQGVEAHIRLVHGRREPFPPQAAELVDENLASASAAQLLSNALVAYPLRRFSFFHCSLASAAWRARLARIRLTSAAARLAASRAASASRRS